MKLKWHIPAMDESPHSKEAIGRRLIVLRTALGIKASDMAGQIGITPQKLNNYESGRNEPPSQVVAALRRATQVSSDWLWFADERYLPVHLYEKIKIAEERLSASPVDQAAERL